MSKNIILFGATGSIGTSVLKILDKTNDKFCLKGITCNQNIDYLIDISNRYKCENLGVSNKDRSNDRNEVLEKKILFMEFKILSLLLMMILIFIFWQFLD
jgi:1-deoxy-D-xylulose-5-phosphate reductoisomerase